MDVTERDFSVRHIIHYNNMKGRMGTKEINRQACGMSSKDRLTTTFISSAIYAERFVCSRRKGGHELERDKDELNI